MRKIFAIFCCLYACTSYAQNSTFLKVDIPLTTPATAPPLDPKVQKPIDLYNSRVKPFRDSMDEKNYLLLYNALHDQLLDTFPAVKKLRDSLPKDTSTFTKEDYTAIVSRVDSIRPASGNDAGKTTAVCPKLAGVSLSYIFQNQSSVLGVLNDSTGNGFKSFLLTQPNEELFYDEIRMAMQPYCDSANVQAVLKVFRNLKPSLYTQYLQEKGKFTNPNEKAGTLKIYKHVAVHSDNGQEQTLTEARKEMNDALETATRLERRLDTLRSKVYSGAKDAKDSAFANLIGNIQNDVKQKLSQALAYRDSINKRSPDSVTAENYRHAIELARNAGKAAGDAIDAVQQMDKQLKNVTSSSSHGPSRVSDILMPVNALQAIGKLPGLFADTPGAGKMTPLPDTNFTIQSIEIQFQDGFIENIKVFGRLKGDSRLFRFENEYPIAFSTKRDFKNLIDIRLFEKSNFRRNNKMVLYLGEVISYSQALAVNNKDYSPANQVVNIDALTDSVKEVILYKDQTSKILELQVFSDLKGADNNNPNGLIQIELIKKLNLFSKRWGVTPKIWPWNWGNGIHYDYMANLGLFNFITPSFSIDKIENNQKRLILSVVDTLSQAADTSRPLTYASTINLLRHQIYSLGVDLSALTLDFPNIKSTLNFGMGLRFGRTALQDTLRVRDPGTKLHFTAAQTNNVIEYGINTFQWGPYATWQIFPDSRFGIWGTQRFTWFQGLSSNFVQVRDSAHYLNFVAQNSTQIRTARYDFSKCLASAEIFAYFNPNSDGSNKLFFRYRLNWDVANPRQNFHQLQVGFSTYLTATKEYDNLKKKADF